MGSFAVLRHLPVLIFCLCALTLSACSSGSMVSEGDKQLVTSSTDKTRAGIDRAIEKALARAEAEGNKEESLALLENIYKRNNTNPEVAVRYARALREDEQMNKARLVLSPHTGKEPYQPALTEMAMVNLGLGQYDQAKKYAREASVLDEKDGRAYLALGTAQDALGEHEQAEEAFREGLEKWKGDPAPILNNLALNLAAQGQTAEALSVLEKARKLSPRRMEIERNYRIISTLNETVTPRAPKPPRKPGTLPDKEASFKGLKTQNGADIKNELDIKEAKMTAPEEREPITLIEPASGQEAGGGESAPSSFGSINN